MSRIGKAPISVPGGVDIQISGQAVTVKGPKGQLSRELSDLVSISKDGDTLQVERIDDSREARAMHGLMRSLVANMVTGVTDGYRKELEIVGVGYRATAKGPGTLELALGFSHPVVVQAPDGVTFDVANATSLAVVGVDKEAVGQVAANIRALRKPEPYKGKGVKYKDERILRKAGKTGK